MEDSLKTIQRIVALVLVFWLVAFPVLAQNPGASPNGITVSGADGILSFAPNGITISGADGITASGADGITASGADGITASGADSTTINHADGITASGADGITISGADGNRYQADSIVVRNPTGITASGADNVIATGVDGITASGADTRSLAQADGITISGADNVLTVNGADGITATGADGSVFAITPSAITITGANGITASGADGITISGADSFVETGTAALSSALLAAQTQTGLQSLDPELMVQLNRLTDDSNVDAVVVFHHLPTDADLADLQRIGVVGGVRYRVLPMVALTATKSQIASISQLPSVRSIYGNRTLQWNLEPAARSLTGVDRARSDVDLSKFNNGLPVSGRGVTVAVLDTGVDGTHGDLSGRIVQNIKLADTQGVGVGFIYPVATPSLPNTDQVYGHGTFVAGVIAGDGKQSNGKYAGVAPGASILGLSAGDASLLFVLSGFDYLLANGASFGVRIVNCSFSANTVFDVNDPVNVATKMLTDSNVSVVFSAGNDGPGLDSLNPYAVAPWVVSVGATDDQARLASFSSRGDFLSPLFRPTLVAPGVNTVSLRLTSLAAVTTIDGMLANDSQLKPGELLYYTTGSGTSFSAPQVSGVIALMLEANPQLTPAEIRDILQRTATPLPPYYQHEVGAGLLNAEAAVLEAAFPERRFGEWRGISYRNQVQFVVGKPYVFGGSAAPGSVSDSSMMIPPDTLLASVQIGWNGLLSSNDLDLTLLDPQGRKQAESDAIEQPGLTGGRQRVILNMPAAGSWTAHVSETTLGSLSLTSENYTGVLEVLSAHYVPLTDIGSVDSSSVAEIYQNFRALVMAPYGSRFRPTFAVTRADFATAMVLGGRVPQYLPAKSNYPDVHDRATMLFVESAQAAPAGPLFWNVTPVGNFQPDLAVDRLTAAVALVRAAGLRQQAESGTYVLTYTDTASIPIAMRGYVAVAVQNGLIRTDGFAFRPQASFTRLDLSHAMCRLATLATQ